MQEAPHVGRARLGKREPMLDGVGRAKLFWDDINWVPGWIALLAAMLLQAAVALGCVERGFFPSLRGNWWELAVMLAAIHSLRYALRTGVSGARRTLVTACFVGSLTGVYGVYATVLVAQRLCGAASPLAPLPQAEICSTADVGVPVMCLLAIMPVYVMEMVIPFANAGRTPRRERVTWYAVHIALGVVTLVACGAWLALTILTRQP